MGGILGDGRNQRRRGGAGADHDDFLVLVVEIVGPLLRMNDPALEGLHGLPLRRITFRVPVIALAHPEEVRREANRFAGIDPDGFDGPEIFLARPPCRGNLVLVADVGGEGVFLDDFAHIAQNLRSGRDRGAGPRLEPVAEGMQVAVGPDAGIAVGQPGSAKAVLRLQDNETCPRTLLGQMVGRAHPGNAGARDDNIEMLGAVSEGCADLLLNVHLPILFIFCSFLFYCRGATRRRPHTSLRLRNARRSNRCTSCSFFRSAPCSGGISLRGSRSLSISGVMSSLSRSFSQSNSSDVEGFFFRPGTSRTSKKIRNASSTRRFLMLGKCTSTIRCMVSTSGNLM